MELQLLEILGQILINQIFPVFAVALTGWLLAHYLHLESRVLSKIALNAFLPCLILDTLISAQIDLLETGRMAVFCILCVLVSGLVALLCVRLLHLDRLTATGLMLVLMFSNVGNFGLPVILFAFGEAALAQGTVYFVIMNLLLYTFGVILVSNGRQSWRDGLATLVKTPIVYSVILALVIVVTRIALPPFVQKPIELMGQGAIPCMLVVLGMQLHSTRIQHTPLTWLAVVLRLAVIPLAMLPLANWLHLSPTAFQAGMVQAATPAGVSTTVLALEYSVQPGFVNNVVLLSTAVSAFTLSPLILFLTS